MSGVAMNLPSASLPFLLALRDVDVSYERDAPGARPALRGVTLEVRPGDRVGLLGPSGAGKSTLLHVMAGLLEPQSGEVRAGAAERRLPSLVMQFPERQLFAATVREDVAYGLRESGVPPPEVAVRVEQALDDVGLPPAAFAARVPFHLSAGEMRRVALAGALAQRRALVLLDEPTLGLDAEGAARLLVILEGLRARGVAYWVASHDVDFVARRCDRVVVLEAGGIAFDGPAGDFWMQSEKAAALGIPTPRAALLAATLRALGARGLGGCPEESELAAALEALRDARRA